MTRLKSTTGDHAIFAEIEEKNIPLNIDTYRSEGEFNEEEENNLFHGFTQSIVTSTQLQTLDLPKRETILGNWFLEGDLGFVYGPRGLGKTWLSLYMAKCISQGAKCGEWSCSNKPRKVLYIDGEMPADGMQERDFSLPTSAEDNLIHLNHEIYFHKTEKCLSLSDPLSQSAILKLCIKQQIEVLFIDNLSCLFSGMRENQADDWELVLPWLLNFRKRRIAIVIIHHSGRSGNNMRGTSRREDAAFWVIRLDNPIKADGKSMDGTQFVSRFTKNRNAKNQLETTPYEWWFEPQSDDKTRITCQKANDIENMKQLIRDGVTSCSDLAEELGVSKGKISKLAKKGITEQWLKKNGRDYEYCGK